MINGYKGTTVKFLGLAPLVATLTSLSADLPKLSGVNSNIQSINNQALGTKGQTLLGQITTIEGAVKGVTTLDAASTNSKSQPTLYNQIEKTDSALISTEFTGIGTLSVQLNDSMTVAS